MVLGHEVGHVVDMLAGTIPQKGLKNELVDIYNSLNNPIRNSDGTDAVAFDGTGRTRPGGQPSRPAGSRLPGATPMRPGPRARMGSSTGRG